MSTPAPRTKLQVTRIHDGALWRVALDAPKGNVLDAVLTAELDEVFREAADEPHLKAVLLAAEGPHFSFGASVEEHRKEHVAGMLAGFHGLVRSIGASGVPVLAAVHGMCLGGGLELAALCQRVFAHPKASFGQPEVTLGVFAPIGSAILAERIGRGAADDLLLTGRVVPCEEARVMRLVDAVDERPEAAALDWADKYLLPRSASSLRFATRAARLGFTQRLAAILPELERLYLEELMATHDATEGLEAFLEKRAPRWSNA